MAREGMDTSEALEKVFAPIDHLMIHVQMPDLSIWEVPVWVVAEDRAAYFAHEFGGYLPQSLEEDTVPLFLQDHSEILDWASNNMDWDQVKMYAKQLDGEIEVDYQEGWINGDNKVVALSSNG